MKIFHRAFKLLKGNYRNALDNGLNVGKGVSIIGEYRGVNFGSEPYLITIGDYCRISMGVMFITHDGGTWAFRDLPGYENIIKYGKINIGAHSFIGARSIIMPGVTIGSRCVVGAGSVVTKDIPDGSVAAGTPARVIMTTEVYAKKCLANQREYDKDAYVNNKKSFLLSWLR